MGICCPFVSFRVKCGPLAAIFFFLIKLFLNVNQLKKTRPQNYDFYRSYNFFSIFNNLQKCTKNRVTFFTFLTFDLKPRAKGDHDQKKIFCSLLVNVFSIHWYWFWNKFQKKNFQAPKLWGLTHALLRYFTVHVHLTIVKTNQNFWTSQI